jgi:hypothetical protein
MAMRVLPMTEAVVAKRTVTDVHFQTRWMAVEPMKQASSAAPPRFACNQLVEVRHVRYFERSPGDIRQMW